MEENKTLKTKICNICLIEKTFDEFSRAKNMPDGHLKRCKTCLRKSNAIAAQKKRTMKSSFKNFSVDQLNIQGANKDDYRTSFQILEILGYDICGDIHSQFCERHNLPVKLRIQKNLNRFSKEELNLC